MLSRIPPVRRSVPLVLAVFIVGAGLGALVIAVTGHSAATQQRPKVLVLGAHRSTDASKATGSGVPTTSRHSATATSEEAGGASAGTPLVPAGAAASFATLAAHLEGEAGLAVAPLGEGPIQTFGSLQAGHAWSTMKVPVLTTLLADYEQSNQSLSPAEVEDATRALEESDNAAAEALFGELEKIDGGLVQASQAVQQTLERAGDHTRINTAPNDEGFTTWGQSIWSAAGEVRFYRALAQGCLLTSEGTEYVLHLMRSVIPSQRWGAGAAGYPSSVPLAFKGGWGPENGAGYLVRQTAIVGTGKGGYVVSMIALPSGGSFEDGVSMITALARWAREHVLSDVSEPEHGCVSPS